MLSPNQSVVPSYSKKKRKSTPSSGDGDQLSGISELSSEREQRMIRQERIKKFKKMQEFELRNVYLRRNKELVKS